MVCFLAVLTESMVMSKIKGGIKKIDVKKNTVITPSAMERIRQAKVEIVYLDEVKSGKKEGEHVEKPMDLNIPDSLPEYPYVCHITEALFKEKPEHMTTIIKNRLVNKDHPRIIFRGAIDSFLAELYKVMVKPNVLDNSPLLSDLISIKDFLKKMQYAEVTESYLEDVNLLGLTAKELREHSHNPQKYYKVDHLFNLDYTAGELVLDLNYLRTKARELEIKAFNAYYECSKLKREDIIKGLNRLSSAFYIMELKAVAKAYKDL